MLVEERTHLGLKRNSPGRSGMAASNRAIAAKMEKSEGWKTKLISPPPPPPPPPRGAKLKEIKGDSNEKDKTTYILTGRALTARHREMVNVG